MVSSSCSTHLQKQDHCCSGLAARSTCINNIREQSEIIKKAADLDYEFY